MGFLAHHMLSLTAGITPETERVNDEQIETQLVVVEKLAFGDREQ